MVEKIKLDIASGPTARPGYDGVDAIEYPNVKHKIDVFKEWKWKENTVDEIFSGMFFEHITYAQAQELLKKFYSSLKEGGKVELLVPDFEFMCKFFLDNPQSRISFQDWRGIHRDDRATKWIFGMQNNEFEFHKSAWTAEILWMSLQGAGFKRVKVTPVYSHGAWALVGEGYKLKY